MAEGSNLLSTDPALAALRDVLRRCPLEQSVREVCEAACERMEELLVSAGTITPLDPGVAEPMPDGGSRVVPDGTGVEWRTLRGAVQYRLSASLFPALGRPGPWTVVSSVDQIVHPARVAALCELGVSPRSPGGSASEAPSR